MFKRGMALCISEGLGQRVPQSGALKGQGSVSISLGSDTGNPQTAAIGRRTKLSGGSVDVEKIGKINRTSRRQSIMTDRKKFILDTRRDWQPVEVVEDRSDMVRLSGLHDQTSGMVLDTLQTISDAFWGTCQKGVTIVESGQYK